MTIYCGEEFHFESFVLRTGLVRPTCFGPDLGFECHSPTGLKSKI